MNLKKPYIYSRFQLTWKLIFFYILIISYLSSNNTSNCDFYGETPTPLVSNRGFHIELLADEDEQQQFLSAVSLPCRFTHSGQRGRAGPVLCLYLGRLVGVWGLRCGKLGRLDDPFHVFVDLCEDMRSVSSGRVERRARLAGEGGRSPCL